MGPSVALRSYKALLGGGERAVALRAALGALRCALALRDELELVALGAYWETLTDVDAGSAIPELVLPLLLRGRAAEGLTIASAELARRPSARSAYLRARALEAAHEPCEEAFRRCAELAGDAEPELATAARSRQLAAMLVRGAPADELLSTAEAVDLQLAAPAQKLLAAKLRLASPSRFARAAALSALEELAACDDEDIARAAVRVAVEHADRMGDDLSWVEADRVAAATAAWPDAGQRAAALARLSLCRRLASANDPDEILSEAADLERGHREHLERARGVMAGFDVEGPAPDGDPDRVVADACLRAIGALRSKQLGADATLRGLIQRLRSEVTNARPLPRGAWVVARLAMTGDGAKHVVLGGLELVELLLKSAVPAPREGYLPFAGVARKQRADDLAEALLRRAIARDEADARPLLVEELARRAGRSAADGDRERALSLLRQARALAE